MEKIQECHPGFAKEDATRITMAGIMDTDRLVRINGEGVGPHPGYKKNGKGLNSLLCEEVADPSDMVDRLGLEVKVAASLAVVILNLFC
jgi:hypothetical protein